MVKFTYHCLYKQSNIETHGALISVGQRLPKTVPLGSQEVINEILIRKSKVTVGCI